MRSWPTPRGLVGHKGSIEVYRAYSLETSRPNICVFVQSMMTRTLFRAVRY